MEEETASTPLIQKAAEDGHISKRQAKALQRVAQKASQAAMLAITHTLTRGSYFLHRSQRCYSDSSHFFISPSFLTMTDDG